LYGVQIAKIAGAQVMLVEPVPFRRQMAKELGADAVFDPREKDYVSQIMEFTEGRGASIVMEASGSDQAIARTVDVVRPHGTIVLVGHSVGRDIPIRIKTAHWKNASIVPSLGQVHYFGKTLVFLSRHLFDPTRIVTHRFPLSEIQKAIEVGKEPTSSIKIVIDIA
jgi:L-iditol 2-dehydrogenase